MVIHLTPELETVLRIGELITVGINGRVIGMQTLSFKDRKMYARKIKTEPNFCVPFSYRTSSCLFRNLCPNSGEISPIPLSLSVSGRVSAV